MLDESTILRFRHWLGEHNLNAQLLANINSTLAQKCLLLKTSIVVDATLIAAPSSEENKDGKREHKMYQAKKGSQ